MRGTVVPVFSSRDDDEAQGLILGHGFLYIADRTPQIRVFDATTQTLTQLDTDGDSANGTTPLALDDDSKPHGINAVTPF